MQTNWYKRLALSAMTFLVLTAVPAFAQQTQASLTGIVADARGAAIPDASVTVTNTDTAIARKVQSSAAGRYVITNLNPGNYTVAVQATGFSEKKLTGVVLTVGQAGSLDVSMAVGGASDTVEVTANAAVTETENSSQGTVVPNQQVVGLPLNTRNFYSLALLSPAAYRPGQASSNGFSGDFNVAGNIETANTTTVNGIDDNDFNVQAPSFRPSVEAIQEFQLLTGVYPAEYGRTSGGQLVVVTKSGSNQLHGDVFEFIRNSQFDAKNYFIQPGFRTTFRRNQFGATVGGPIVKDRTFFFLSYEGLRLAQPVVATTTVPNPAFKTGDFSSVCTSGFTGGICNTASQQLKNPATGIPYANNQIPVTTFDPIGRAILNIYPSPNTGTNGYTLDEARIENLNEGSARVDHKFSDKDSILAQYNYFEDPTFEPSLSVCFSGLIPSVGCYQNQISTLAGINETHIFNAHLLNEMRFGFDRYEQPRINEDASNTAFPKVPGAFNDPSVPANLLGGPPVTNVAGYAPIHAYTSLPQHRWDDHFNFVDNVSWSHGPHNLKFGVNLLESRSSYLFVVNGTGNFTFTGASNSAGSLTSGNAASDLALGYATSSARTTTAPVIHTRYNSYSGFAQDDWKVASNLTLNLGLRYEFFAPIKDTRNILASWRAPSAGNPSGTIVVAGQNGQGSTVYNGDLNNFAPRAGFAWQPFHNSRTVVHGGYGVFYNSPTIGTALGLQLGITAPFRLGQTFTSSAAAQSILSTNPFPQPGTAPNGSQALPYTNIAPYGWDPNYRTQYLDQYGLDIQQQLTPTIALTVGYLGSEGVHLARPILPNQASNMQPTYNGSTTIPAGATPNGVVSSRQFTAVSGPIANPLQLNAAQTGYTGPLYFTYGNITEYISGAHSTYQALTIKAQRISSKGFNFIVAYTWGKSLDNAPGSASISVASTSTPQNSFDLRSERGLSDFNVSSRLVISPVYELPFGKGRAYLNHGFGGTLASGWQLSGIYQFDSGRPFTIASSQNRSGSIYGTDRPNLIANPNAGPKTVNQWFNTAAFVANGYAQFGSEGRNSIIGPTYSQMDVAVQRSFPVSEHLQGVLRFESFNVLNHPNFLNPLGVPTAGLAAGQFVPSSTAQNAPAVTPATSPSSIFGKLTQANDPRSIQFSAKIIF